MMITIDDENPPPVQLCNSSIHSFERGSDPFHPDAFPDEFKDLIKEVNYGRQMEGWFALDYWGNQIGFIPDGNYQLEGLLI